MLASIQQHPDLSCGRASKNARKYRAAPNAGVALCDPSIIHRTGTIER
jgi:hypothetical protein